jgi:hypothetical protein
MSVTTPTAMKADDAADAETPTRIGTFWVPMGGIVVVAFVAQVLLIVR